MFTPLSLACKMTPGLWESTELSLLLFYHDREWTPTGNVLSSAALRENLMLILGAVCSMPARVWWTALLLNFRVYFVSTSDRICCRQLLTKKVPFLVKPYLETHCTMCLMYHCCLSYLPTAQSVENSACSSEHCSAYWHLPNFSAFLSTSSACHTKKTNFPHFKTPTCNPA